MVRSATLIVCFLLVLGLCNSAFSETVIATETSRGEWENGKLARNGMGEFEYRFVVNEESGKALLTESKRLKDGSLISENIPYVITYVDTGDTVSSTVLSHKRKQGKKVICLVGNRGTVATEVILLGEDFFEYSQASSGRFYLSTGKVQRLISPVEDTVNQMQSSR